MINSELLKEAIADAKAVRATALANAKAALEEAFRPRFEAMFAEKLKEESEEEEEGCSMDEVSAPNQVSGTGGEAKGPKTKDVTKGQPHKGSAAKKDFKTIAVGGSEGAAGSKAPAAKQSIVKETAEEEEESVEESVEEAGLSTQDLDEIIKELEAEVSGEEEGAPAPQFDAPPVAQAPEGGEGEMPPMDMPAPAPEGGEGEMPPMDMPAPEPDGDEGGGEVPMDMPAPEAAPEGGEGEVPMDMAAPAPAPAPEGGEEGGEKEIDLDELLAALNEEAEEEEEGKLDEKKGLPPWLQKKGEKGEKEDDDKEEVDEAVSNGVPTNNLKGQDKGAPKGMGYPKAPQDASKKQLTGKNHNIQGKGGIENTPSMSENKQLKSEINECIKTIEFLRGQINEVNLLNAKLLYTNKLFKEFAQVLDDPYRMKIVEAFDLTKNVREVKLAYALLAESLNFGTQVQKARTGKTAPKQAVRQITEGLASRPVASTKPSANLITEGANEMANRFKKLAGIKTPQPKQ